MAEGRRAAGRSVRRRDFAEKVTGAAVYAADATVPGMAHAVVVRSERAHAELRGIDVEAAAAAPGVVCVVTAADLAPLFARFGHIVADHRILADDRVRYLGEPVAVVVAETRTEAADAARLVQVSYDDLPAVMDVEQALAPGAPLVHEETYDTTGDDSFTVLTGVARAEPVEAGEPGRRSDNVMHEVRLEWGDVDEALAGAAQVVEGTTHYPMLYGYAMEPYNALATFGDEGLHVIASQQHPYMCREDLARIFDLPLSRVRVEVPYIGGGYGTKSYTKVEPLASVASWCARRPVRLVLDVEESILTTRVDSATVRVRSGFAQDGTLLARDIDIVLDSGAYADNSPLVLAKAVNRSFGPYRIPHLRVRGRAVYTNTSPASSYRGFGAPQGNLAGETNMDQAADRLGISRLEIRRRNLVAPGERLMPRKRGLDADVLADLEMVVDSLERDAVERDGYGIGFGVSASDAGAYPVSTAHVRVQVDGSVTVLSGSTEMGQGSRSLLAQVAAEELGVAMDVVHVVQSDTAVTPYERTTGASRTSTLVGLAVQYACADLRSKLRAMAAEVLDVAVDEIGDGPGTVVGADGAELAFAEVVTRWFGAKAGEVTGIGLLRRSGATQEMPPFWEVGVVGVGLDVDRETGVVTVDQLVTVGDVGFAINPAAVEAQDLGAATQGLGAALHEELVYDGQQLMNANVVDYRVPRAVDTPRKIDLILAERGDGVGPWGAKGAGEGSLNPIGGAVASAFAAATGVWPDRLPLTPERVWRLLGGGGPEVVDP